MSSRFRAVCVKYGGVVPCYGYGVSFGWLFSKSDAKSLKFSKSDAKSLKFSKSDAKSLKFSKS